MLASNAFAPMSEAAPKTFEEKLKRIDEIVTKLESGAPDLEKAIALFKEGKTLARECEALLKRAQQQVDEALADSQAEVPRHRAGAANREDEIPF
jgi:exodeoxyribonuclease VII small subunit